MGQLNDSIAPKYLNRTKRRPILFLAISNTLNSEIPVEAPPAILTSDLT
jgi:hypothetical protein